MKQFKDVTTSDIFSHWINIAYLPRWGVLLLDLFIVFVAFIISIIIGNNLWGYSFPSLLFPIWLQILILLITQCVFFWAFHTYSGILRYSTFVDTIKVILAATSCGATLLVINSICKPLLAATPFLTSSLIIYTFIAICFLFIWRVIIKTTFEYISFHNTKVKKVLIYGTQSAGLSIAKMLLSNIESTYRPVGFITDDINCSNHNLLGLDIYPYNQNLISLMKEKGIKYVIVSPMKMKEINPLKDLAIFLNNDIQILTTPYFTDFSSHALEDNISKVIGRIESIKVEDLLERPVIDIDTENVEAILRNRIIMVTGAAGSIGSEIVRQVAIHHPRAIILLEMAESPLHDLTVDLRRKYPELQLVPIIADVRNQHMIDTIFSEYHPHIVFHAAAYKHVPLMEDFPTQAIIDNVL